MHVYNQDLENSNKFLYNSDNNVNNVNNSASIVMSPAMKKSNMKSDKFIDLMSMEATKISIMKSNPSIMSGGFVLASTKRSTKKLDLP